MFDWRAPPHEAGPRACARPVRRGVRCFAGWAVWLALALLLAAFAGHGFSRPPVAQPPAALTIAPPPAPVSVALDPIRLSPRSWYVQGDSGMISLRNEGFNSNAGFVVTDEGVVVFDTLGTPALGSELLKRIRAITDKPVRHVVISHYHSDHFYGTQAFKAAGAEVWAHRSGRDYLATDAPRARLEERRRSLSPWVTDAARIVPADHWIDAETILRLGGLTFRLIPVGPAHTPEDLMMLVEEDGVLFAGDLMFAGRVPFVGNADSKGWLAALERLLAREPKVIVGGHGGASTDAARDLALTRDYLRFLREQMGRAVEEMVGFDEAYERTDWSGFESLPAFDAANRRNAYNTYILLEREALGTQ
jgi:glyoxylase-like metal-dependent hydrolase (beta-lactamase superfamily II)